MSVDLECSFCDKNEHKVTHMMKATKLNGTIAICNECVACCVSAFIGEQTATVERTTAGGGE